MTKITSAHHLNNKEYKKKSKFKKHKVMMTLKSNISLSTIKKVSHNQKDFKLEFTPTEKNFEHAQPNTKSKYAEKYLESNIKMLRKLYRISNLVDYMNPQMTVELVV